MFTLIFLSALQVWYIAVTQADGRSGSISSSVLSNAGDAAGKLKVESVHILGASAAEGTPAVTASLNGVPLAAEYDQAAGSVKILGIGHTVGEPLSISWSLESFSG